MLYIKYQQMKRSLTLFRLFISVPAAEPITFAKINFNVIGLKETKDFVKLIKVGWSFFGAIETTQQQTCTY